MLRQSDIAIRFAAAFLCAASGIIAARAETLSADWTAALSVPAGYLFARRAALVRTWTLPDFTVEFYRQANGPGTSQRVFVSLPKKRIGRSPAVVVPFYYPEAMLGFDPETGAWSSENSWSRTPGASNATLP